MNRKDEQAVAPASGSGSEPRQPAAPDKDPPAAPDLAKPTAGAGAQQGSKQDSLMLGRAVGRWENEGGAETVGAEAIRGAVPEPPARGDPRVALTNAELVQLQLRVIALENLVTALLAVAPGDTADLVRAMAANISPRADSTPHHLTVRAAAQMIHLLERAQLSRNTRVDGDR